MGCLVGRVGASPFADYEVLNSIPQFTTTMASKYWTLEIHGTQQT